MEKHDRKIPDVADTLHDAAAQRYVLRMEPADAFASYEMEGDTKVLTHVEVDPAWRGTGLGERFAGEVLNRVLAEGGKARITCPYMRGLAAKHPVWAAHYGLA